MTFRGLMVAGAALVLAAPPAVSAPTQPIGAAVTIVNLVTAEFDRDTRTLQNGDKVHEDENIAVGGDSRGELKLDDETKLALGPGSRLKLDKFVYDPNKDGGSIILDLVKGTFRFVTGVASKPTYVIRTPAASITVRGTIFDLFVQEDGTAWLLLQEGAVRVCGDSGNCRVVDEPGKLLRVIKGDVGAPVKWAALPGKESVPFDKAFPFVSDAPSFATGPVLTRDVIILGNLPSDKADGGKDGDKGKSTDTENTKPKKERTRASDTPKETPKKKATKTASKGKKRTSDDSNIVNGMDIVIGIGVGGIGKRGGGHKNPGNDMPRSTGPK